MRKISLSKPFLTIQLVGVFLPGDNRVVTNLPTTEYSGEFSYLNFSNKIRKKIDEWMKTAAPEVSSIMFHRTRIAIEQTRTGNYRS